MLARLEYAQHHPENVPDAMYMAERLADEHHLLPRYSIWVKCALARLWLAIGDLDKAADLIQKAGFSSDDEILYLDEPRYLILLRLFLARGDCDSALSLAQSLLRRAEAAKRMGRVVEILVLQALIYQQMKNADQALSALQRALALARPEKYVRTFLDEGKQMILLLHLAKSRGILSEYVSKLLTGMGRAGEETQVPGPELTEPLSRREAEVLKLIETGFSNQEIAEQLFISIATVKRHISNIYAKLGVQNRTQAVSTGKELGLLR
jgi:LuxR family maltose regulon positive regulatory protein